MELEEGYVEVEGEEVGGVVGKEGGTLGAREDVEAAGASEDGERVVEGEVDVEVEMAVNVAGREQEVVDGGVGFLHK